MSGVARGLFHALICGIAVPSGAMLAAAMPAHAAPPQPPRNAATHPLPTLLADLARATDTELLFDERLVRGLRAKRPARGQSVAAALRVLLEGTGVGFRRTPDGAYVLFREDEPDVAPDALPAVPDILVVGRRLLNTDIKRSENDIQPYKVFTGEEVDTAHRDNLGLFFRARLPANTDILPPIQQLTQQFGQPQSSIDLRGAGTQRTLVLIDGRRLPSLPGLLSDFDQSDLNGVPMGAIERIEVLTSTAGGIFGPNATGGVVNVVLRRDYRGAELNVISGISSRGDAARVRVEGRIGLSSGDGSTQFMMFGSYAVSDRLRVGQRDYTIRAREMAYANDPEGYVFLSGSTSGTPVSNSLLVVSASATPLSFDPEYGGASLGSRFTYLPLDFRGTDAEKRAVLLRNAGKVDLSLSPGASGADGSLINDPTVLSAIVSARHQFGDGGPEIFVDGLYFRNEGEMRLASDGGRAHTLADAPGNPFAQRIIFRFPGDLEYVNRTRIEMLRLVGGAILTLPGQWKAEADFTYGKLIHRISQIAPEIDFAPNSPTSFVLFNGNPSPDGRPALRPLEGDWQTFRAALATYVTITPATVRMADRLTNMSLRLAGPLARLPGGPSSLTLLAERRRESIPIADPQGLGATPLRREIVIKSAYAELRAPLLPQDRGFLPLRGLELQLAGRHDALRATLPDSLYGAMPGAINLFSVRRQATVFTLGGRVVPVPALMLRGSYATGTVPPLLDQFQSTDLPPEFLAIFTPDPRRGGQPVAASGRYVTRIGGSHDIQQETGDTLSLGAVLNPFGARGPRLSIDYSRISIRREIKALGIPPNELLVREAEFPDRIVRAPLTDADRALGYTAGRVLEFDLRMANSGETELHAVDAQLSWPVPGILGGELVPYANLTWQPSVRSRNAPQQPWVERVGYRDGPLGWRGNGGVRWRRGGRSVDLNMQYYDGYRITLPPPGGDQEGEQQALRFQGGQRIPAQVYVDLALGWQFALSDRGPARMIEARFGIQNLLDRSPPILAHPSLRGNYSPFADPRRRRFELAISIRR